jgi:hypothetical protein
VIEEYASGSAGHPGGYFIDCESALGVMIGWRALLWTMCGSRTGGWSLPCVMSD